MKFIHVIFIITIESETLTAHCQSSKHYVSILMFDICRDLECNVKYKLG